MVDWTKPIEAVHEDGRVAEVLLDNPATFGRTNPDRDGDWWTTNPVRGGMQGRQCWKPDGTPEGGSDDNYGWRIRNRAEPANDELAELRAFKEAAIARFPELAPVEVDPDILQARKIALKFALPAQFSGMTSHRTNQGEFDDSDVMAAIGEAMDWARANPR